MLRLVLETKLPIRFWNYALAIALLTVGSNLVTDELGRAVAGVGRRVEG